MNKKLFFTTNKRIGNSFKWTKDKPKVAEDLNSGTPRSQFIEEKWDLFEQDSKLLFQHFKKLKKFEAQMFQTADQNKKLSVIRKATKFCKENGLIYEYWELRKYKLIPLYSGFFLIFTIVLGVLMSILIKSFLASKMIKERFDFKEGKPETRFSDVLVH